MRTSLLSNSRTLINTPLDSKSLYVNFLAKEVAGKGNSITRALATFGSKAFAKEKAFTKYHLPPAELQEAPFRFFGSSIQFVESDFRETSQRTDQSMLFGGEERKKGSWAESREGAFGGEGAFMGGNLVMYECYLVVLIRPLLNPRESHLSDLAGVEYFSSCDKLSGILGSLSVLPHHGNRISHCHWSTLVSIYISYPLSTDSGERI